MSLKIVMDKLDDIDEPVRKLYSEKDGKFVLTGIEGVKTQADIERLTRAAALEREEHKKTKEKYKPFDAYLDDVDGVLGKLDKYEELEAAAKGKIDDKKLDEMVENRLKGKLSPLEREKKKLADEVATLRSENESLKAAEQRRRIHDMVRGEATKSKMVETAIEDALYLAERVMIVKEDGTIVTKEGVGVTPDADPATWLSEMQPKRPHWWPQSQGGGGRGSGGSGGYANNPWSKDGWNVTEQGRILNTNPTQAENMARSAGVEIGAARPKG